MDAQKIIRDQFLDLATNFASQLLGHPVPADELDLLRTTIFGDVNNLGGDTWVFDSPNSAATPVTTSGFNNADNWGNRGIIPIDDRYPFFGTNGGYNYPTTPATGPSRRAGWQLLRMGPR